MELEQIKLTKGAAHFLKLQTNPVELLKHLEQSSLSKDLCIADAKPYLQSRWPEHILSWKDAEMVLSHLEAGSSTVSLHHVNHDKNSNRFFFVSPLCTFGDPSKDFD